MSSSSMNQPTCRIVNPITKDACGLPAVCVIVFYDNTRTNACRSCAMNLKEVAEKTFHTTIQILTINTP